MTENVLQDVDTQGVSFGPILKHYFDLCRIKEIIDQSVPMDPRRKILTHGQASVAMITAILFQLMQLYRICDFADKTTVLDVLFPDIKPEEYFDDRLADTLDALFQYGLGDLEIEITKHLKFLAFKTLSAITTQPLAQHMAIVPTRRRLRASPSISDTVKSIGKISSNLSGLFP